MLDVAAKAETERLNPRAVVYLPRIFTISLA